MTLTIYIYLRIPSLCTAFEEVRVHALVAEDQECEFLLDSVSLTEIPSNSNWREEADKRIDELRKGTLKIKYDLLGSVVPSPTHKT